MKNHDIINNTYKSVQDSSIRKMNEINMYDIEMLDENIMNRKFTSNVISYDDTFVGNIIENNMAFNNYAFHHGITHNLIHDVNSDIHLLNTGLNYGQYGIGNFNTLNHDETINNFNHMLHNLYSLDNSDKKLILS